MSTFSTQFSVFCFLEVSFLIFLPKIVVVKTTTLEEPRPRFAESSKILINTAWIQFSASINFFILLFIFKWISVWIVTVRFCALFEMNKLQVYTFVILFSLNIFVSPFNHRSRRFLTLPRSSPTRLLVRMNPNHVSWTQISFFRE